MRAVIAFACAASLSGIAWAQMPSVPGSSPAAPSLPGATVGRPAPAVGGLGGGTGGGAATGVMGGGAATGAMGGAVPGVGGGTPGVGSAAPGIGGGAMPAVNECMLITDTVMRTACEAKKALGR